MASQNSTQEPSMLRGHADYANGAVQVKITFKTLMITFVLIDTA